MTGHEMIVHQIVDRCHVGERYGEVIRYMISRLADGIETFRSMPVQTRRDICKVAIKRHRANRKLFSWIDGGLKGDLNG